MRQDEHTLAHLLDSMERAAEKEARERQKQDRARNPASPDALLDKARKSKPAKS